ncbi:type VII secretion protein EccB [Actinoplanes sp. L3-i22]|uniref:type VII secretion protein EccB n=1 Tax=Actinoplanes sp. L3-i22 TaxID=2836373 RepID=UPI001C74D4CE|nr:type VII secretion protein EccB [Actinoplanes sp. L3-i22]BCY13388.1 type VII secretion protein EccB [Actinoplanes sp. L3-i22]
MQTQRDHVHAHQFQMARMSSALLLGDPSMAENPMRRTSMGLAIGLVIGLLTVVCFGVYGWIVPGGNNSWRKGGSIIVEKESGTRYVYLDGRLFPTLNLASAMILNGGAKIELVSRNSLKDVPIGAPIGIPGAPQLMPSAAGDILRGPWLACLGGSVSASAGDQIGLNLDPAAPATELPGNRFALVTSGSKEYLIWQGRKHLITDPSIPVALGATSAVPVPAPAAWTEMVPAGDPIEVPEIPGAGSAEVTVDGRQVKAGALFSQAANGGEQYFVLRKDGLTAVNRTMLLLLQAAYHSRPVALDAAAVAAAPRSGDRSMTEAFDGLADATALDDSGLVLCQRQAPSGKNSVDSRVVVTTPGNAALARDGAGSVRLPAGAGMVVTPIPPATASSPADPYLIADQGQKYHLTDKKATSALGLVDGYQVPFPRALLQRITSGPDLAVDAITTSAAAGQPAQQPPAAAQLPAAQQQPPTPGNVKLQTLKPPPPSAGVSSEPGR